MVRSNSAGGSKNFLSALFSPLHKASSNPLHHWRAILAEFFGTCVFITFCTLIPASGSALFCGLALISVIFSIGHISGGHVNPAVTASLMVTRAIPVVVGVCYWIAQFSGSLLSAFICKNIGHELTFTNVIGSYTLQFLTSGFLCFVVLSTAVDAKTKDSRNILAALPIGFAVSVGVAITSSLQSSMNPAGFFGKVVLGSTKNDVSYSKLYLLYILTPMMTGVVVGLFHKVLIMTRPNGICDIDSSKSDSMV